MQQIRVEIESAPTRLKLNVYDWPGSGQAFVLVHGLASNGRTWTAVAEQLNNAGHRVVAVDLRGHGLSDKLDDGYDFGTISHDLLALLDTLALEQPLLAGQSWGGNVMLAFAALYPGRAAGFAFVDGGTLDLQSRTRGTWEEVAEDLRPPALAGKQLTWMRERMQQAHPDWSQAGIEHTLANFELLPDGAIRPWLTLDRHMMILRALWEQRPSELFSSVREPVLICMAGGGSAEWVALKRSQVAKAAQRIPKNQVVWFEDADHDIHVHRPQQLAAHFLDARKTGIWSDHAETL